MHLSILNVLTDVGTVIEHEDDRRPPQNLYLIALEVRGLKPFKRKCLHSELLENIYVIKAEV